ncbi:MAG: PEP/pyruvate-binding domain-containing protein [Roseibium sp.]
MARRLIILGAGKPHGAGQPFGIRRVTLNDRILDWQLAAFKDAETAVTFVGGYDIAHVVNEFSELDYVYNPHWKNTGSGGSLIAALKHEIHDVEKGDVFILYSDVLVRPDLVTLLSGVPDRGIAIAVDEFSHTETQPREREAEHIKLAEYSAEFVGLFRVAANDFQSFVSSILSREEEFSNQSLSSVLNTLAKDDFKGKLTIHQAKNAWAHAEHSRAVARFVLGSKASTLKNLSGHLKHSQVLPLVDFTYKEWSTNPNECLLRITDRFSDKDRFVVRSSAQDEDGFDKANAGKYHSELNIENCENALSCAVDRVFASYGHAGAKDEVLVQPHLSEVVGSGVLFTRQLATGAPYYVINFSPGKDTTAVTSGTSESASKFYVLRNCKPEQLAHLPVFVQQLISCAQEIENLVLHDALDIEFAILTDGSIATLQCRPLIINDNHQDRSSDDIVFEVIKTIADQLRKLDTPAPGILGDNTVWSVMADWNPAEIIGTSPSNLALDLYRYIITDSTWAVQRQQVGYRFVNQVPLVRRFGGQAFVDVRSSINSFVPENYPENLATNIIEFGLNRLRMRPDLHDKIEFELLPTCLNFDFQKWHKLYLAEAVIDVSGIATLQKSLRTVTNAIIARSSQDLENAQALELEYTKLLTLLPQGRADGIRIALNRCRDEGALVFAHLARAGFVAVSLLKSAVTRGFLSEERYNGILASTETIGSLIQKEAWEVKTKKRSFEEFTNRFGHIRPGTYDVTAASYGENPETYFMPIIEASLPLREINFNFTEEETGVLDNELAKLGLNLNADGFLNFVRTAISGREYSKFVFTKLLSFVIAETRSFGQRTGVLPENLDLIPSDLILDETTDIWSTAKMKSRVALRVQDNLEDRYLSSEIILPPILTNPAHIFAFEAPPTSANFISGNRALAPLVILEKGMEPSQELLQGKIVAIVNADPGYDFLFGMQVSGLITAFGGPNSHMAIRAAEFDLPAAIGIGQEQFSNLQEGAITTLDCRQGLLGQNCG